MVINADGIKLNGVAPSVWSMWYFFLEMIELPRYSCVPASYDTSNHVKVPKDLVRDSRNPRRGRRRRILSDLLGSERSFDTHRKAVQVASTHSLLSFRNGQTHGRTLVRPLGLQFRPDQEPLVRNDAGRNNVHPWRARAKLAVRPSCAGLRLVVVRRCVSEVGSQHIR